MDEGYRALVSELESIPEVSNLALQENPYRIVFTLTVGGLQTRLFLMNRPVVIKENEYLSLQYKMAEILSVPRGKRLLLKLSNGEYLLDSLMIGLEEAPLSSHRQWFDLIQRTCPRLGYHLLLTLEDIRILIEELAETPPPDAKEVTVNFLSSSLFSFGKDVVLFYSPHFGDVDRKVKIALKLYYCQRETYTKVRYISKGDTKEPPDPTKSFTEPVSFHAISRTYDNKVGLGVCNNFQVSHLREVILRAKYGGFDEAISSLLDDQIDLIYGLNGGSVSLCIATAGGGAAQFFPTEIRSILDQSHIQHLIILVDPYIFSTLSDNPLFRSWRFRNIRFFAISACYTKSCNEKLFEFFSTLHHMGVSRFNLYPYMFDRDFSVFKEMCREQGININFYDETSYRRSSRDDFDDFDLAAHIPDGVRYSGGGPVWGYFEFSYDSVADILQTVPLQH